MDVLVAKVVSNGRYLAVCCPFCKNAGKTADSKFHLHVLPGKWVYCFRCNYKNSYARFASLYKISNLPIATKKHKVVASEFEEFVAKNTQKFNNSYYSASCLSYLRKRKITGEVVGKLNILSGINNLFGRVVFVDSLNKYYVGRAIFGDTNPKTLNPAGVDKPLMYMHSYSYDTLYLVEGCFDVIPFVKSGRDAVAILGKDLSPNQIAMLSGNKIINLIVVLDADAVKESFIMADKLAKVLPLTNIGAMMYKNRKAKDPGEYDLELFYNTDIVWRRVIDEKCCQKI